MKESIMRGEMTFMKTEGIDKRYLSIRDNEIPLFTRNNDKPEAGVIPEADGTITVEVQKNEKKVQIHPYEKSVNGKVKKAEL